MPKKTAEIEFHIAAIANTVPPKMRRAVAEGIRAILKVTKFANLHPPLELIAYTESETIAVKPAGLQPHAKPPRTPLPPSIRRVSELSPEQLVKRREQERTKKAKLRACLKLQNNIA